MKSPDLSHHRAYRSVHGGSLVFINLQVIAGHGHIALTGYFFVRPCWAHKKNDTFRRTCHCNSMQAIVGDILSLS